MKKILFFGLCCLCLCGCSSDKEKKLKRTECINQHDKNTIVWSLYHDGNQIYQISREDKTNYNTVEEAIQNEQKSITFYKQRKKEFENNSKQKVLIDINRKDNIVIEKITFDCAQNNFFPNVTCDYTKEIQSFENDLISFACIEKD